MMRNDQLEQLLAAGARELGINLSLQQTQQMMVFMAELLDWNQRVNLTSITDEYDVITKHFLDSLSIIQAIPQDTVSLLDIGSGGGFPGIPVQIAKQDLQVYLLDSIKKKTDFLLRMQGMLGIPFVVYTLRAEDGARTEGMREKFDVVVSRAVAGLPVLCEYCLPYVRLGGVFIAMKSEEVDDELIKAQRAIHVLGGGDLKIEKIKIPYTDIYRKLIIIDKTAQTPAIYPRRAGMPEKRPL
jgi:16S rRNA (guanine527-N7)-methyltransferase